MPNGCHTLALSPAVHSRCLCLHGHHIDTMDSPAPSADLETQRSREQSQSYSENGAMPL